MSLLCMTRVWAEADAKGSELLMMLALADFAHDDGTKAFPSVPTLAAKSRMSKRSVQRILRVLEDRGLITCTGTTKNGTNVYHVLPPVEEVGGCKDDTHSGGAKLSPGGDARVTGGGDAGVTGGVTHVSPNPSMNRQDEPSGEEQQQHAGASGTSADEPGTLTEEETAVRSQLLGLGVFPVAADRLLREHGLAWLGRVIGAARWLRTQGGQPGNLGSVVVSMADRETPLPAVPSPGVQAARHVGRVPEAARAVVAVAEAASGPPASDDVVAASMAEAERLMEEGTRKRAEARARALNEKRAGRRGPDASAA